MASVPYLTGGEAITADTFDLIFSTLDEKIRKILGGKSWSFIRTFSGGSSVPAGTVSIDTTGFGGNVFRFGFGDGSDYNHSAFDTFAASLVVTSYDEALRIANVATSTTTLDGSLAAHFSTKDGIKYYFKRTDTQFPNDPPDNRKPYRPERKHRLAVAEIYYGGPQDSLSIPDAYDKYNCFRLHNVTAQTVTFNFGSNHSVAVAAYGQRAVRRDSVTGDYDSSRYYLFPVQSGDRRYFQFNSTQPVLSSMAANNVANPCMVFPLIRQLSDPSSSAYFIHNPHENVTPSSASLYGDITDAATKLGDIMFHEGAGALVDASGNSTAFDFAGLSSMVADFAAIGVTATFSGNVATIQKSASDLVALGTNLLKNGAASRGAVYIDTAVALDPVFSPVRFYDCPRYSESTTTQTFTSPTGSFTGLIYTINGPADFSNAARYASFTLGIGDTVATPLAAIVARSQGISTFTSTMVFSPFGPTLQWTETISPTRGYATSSAASQAVIQSLLDNPNYSFEDGSFVRKGVWFYDGHGFPFYQMIPEASANFTVATSNLQTNILACLFGDQGRITSGILKKGSLDGIRNESVAPDGGDYDVAPLTGGASSIAVQQTLSDSIESTRFTSFRSPDSLQLYSTGPAQYIANRPQLLEPQIITEFDSPNLFVPVPHVPALHVRLRLSRNGYNMLAWAVNRLVKGKVLDFGAVTGFQSQLGVAASGVIAWPRNAYSVWTGTQYDALANALGIPIKTLADFPSYDYAHFGITIYERAGLGAKTLSTQFGTNPSYTNPIPTGVKWVAVEDVQAVAESMGFPFNFFRVGSPLTVKTTTSDRFGVSVVPGSATPDDSYIFGVRERFGFVPALTEDEFEFLTDNATAFLSVDDPDVFLAQVSGANGTVLFFSTLPADQEDVDWQHDLTALGSNLTSVGFITRTLKGVVSASTEPQVAALLLVPVDYNKSTKNYFTNPSPFPFIPTGGFLQSVLSSENHQTNCRRPAHRVVNNADPVTITPPAGYSVLYAGTGSPVAGSASDEGAWAVYTQSNALIEV